MARTSYIRRPGKGVNFQEINISTLQKIATESTNKDAKEMFHYKFLTKYCIKSGKNTTVYNIYRTCVDSPKRLILAPVL